jgi:hypothetical protein
MTARNVEARIVKLEVKRRRPDELLLIWRQPGAAVTQAVAGADFAAGDRVICVEWFGDEPSPAPRWFRNRLSAELGEREYGYISRSLDRLVQEPEPVYRDQGFAPMPVLSAARFADLTDNDLLHIAFGIET